MLVLLLITVVGVISVGVLRSFAVVTVVVILAAVVSVVVLLLITVVGVISVGVLRVVVTLGGVGMFHFKTFRLGSFQCFLLQ